MQETDVKKAKDLYYNCVEDYTGEQFFEEVERYNRGLTELVRKIDSKQLEHDIDLATGELVSRSELKGFIVGLRQRADLLRIMGATSDEPQAPSEPPSNTSTPVHWFDGTDPDTGRAGRLLAINGEVHNTNQWCKILGCSRTTLLARLFKGDAEIMDYVAFRKSI